MEKDQLILSTLALFEANYGVKLEPMYRAFLAKKMADYPASVISAAFENILSKYSRTAQDPEYKLYAAYPDWSIIKTEIDKLYNIPCESKLAELTAETAWNTLLDKIEQVGYARQPTGFDQTTLYCIKSLGGWTHVCSWLESELTWRKKEFIDLFRSAHDHVDELMAGVDAVEALGMRRSNMLNEAEPITAIVSRFMAKQPKGLPQ